MYLATLAEEAAVAKAKAAAAVETAPLALPAPEPVFTIQMPLFAAEQEKVAVVAVPR